MLFFVCCLLATVSSIDNKRREPKQRPSSQLPQNRIKALKVNYPYTFFNADSDDWRTPSPVYSEALAKSTKSYTRWSRAQDHEDIWLYENWFYGMTNGIIIESGALDGVKYSTTFLFEYFANWTPIHIGNFFASFIHYCSNVITEADPRNFFKLSRSRENGVSVNAALCSETTLLHYTNDDGGQIQGFVEFMSPAFLRKWHPKIYKNITRLEDLATVQCVQMKKLTRELNLRHADIWVLDVEGAELSVLRGTDFTSISISTIVMECDQTDAAKDAAKQAILESNGYECTQVERNCFCKHESFQPSEAPPEQRQYASFREKYAPKEKMYDKR